MAGITFPADFTVRFSTPLPADASKRAVIEAFEKQQAGFVYTLYVKHSDKRYLQWTEVNAAPVFGPMVNKAQSGGSGVIQYSDIQVTGKIYTFPAGSGAGGTFCLDTNSVQGVTPIMPGGPYQFFMHKDPGGTWKVSSMQKGGASSCDS